MMSMETGSVQALRYDSVRSMTPGSGACFSISAKPIHTAMMQGCSASFLSVSRAVVCVKHDSPADHMKNRSGMR